MSRPRQAKPSSHEHVVFPHNAFSVLPVTQSVALVFFCRNTDQITLRPFICVQSYGQISRIKHSHPQIESRLFQDCLDVAIGKVTVFTSYPLLGDTEPECM